MSAVEPLAAAAPTIAVVVRSEDASVWAGLRDRLAEATRCRVSVTAADGGAPDAQFVATALDRVGFERGLLVGDELHAASVAAYLGRVADHRVRGLVLLRPRLFAGGEGGWDAREAIGYVRVPIQIVHGSGDPGASEQVAAVEDEAYCPVEVTAVAGAGADPARERAEGTLGAVAAFVHTLLDEAGERVAPVGR